MTEREIGAAPEVRRSVIGGEDVDRGAENRRGSIGRTAAAAAVLTVAAVILWVVLGRLTGTAFAGKSGYYTYTLQAMAWRRGALSLGRDYPWLELAVYEGDWYVSFPPVPTVPVWLLTFVFGSDVPDNLLVKLYALVGMLAAFMALRAGGWKAFPAAFAALCTAFCGSAAALSTQGAVWYQAQMAAFMTILLAVWLARRGSVTAALLCYALSVGCRPFNVAYGPLIMLMWFARQKRRTLAVAARGLWKGVVLGLCVAAAMAAYNWARFGNPLEFGTNYLPEFMRSKHGQFSLTHLAGNARSFLLGLPLERGEDGAWAVKKFGFSLFIANPLLACLVVRFALDAARRRLDAVRLACAILFAAQLFLLLLHRTFGGFQFGARYAVDLVPYFVCYACSDGEEPRLRPWEWALGAAGIAFALYGVAMVHI